MANCVYRLLTVQRRNERGVALVRSSATEIDIITQLRGVVANDWI